MQYEPPEIRILGTVEELTLNHGGTHFDKIGSTADFLTPQNPNLDGSIVPDT